MPRAELFDIANNVVDQREAEIALTPEQRLLLCLDLMDLSYSLSNTNRIVTDDQIEWIELSFRDE